MNLINLHFALIDNCLMAQQDNTRYKIKEESINRPVWQLHCIETSTNKELSLGTYNSLQQALIAAEEISENSKSLTNFNQVSKAVKNNHPFIVKFHDEEIGYICDMIFDEDIKMIRFMCRVLFRQSQPSYIKTISLEEFNNLPPKNIFILDGDNSEAKG